MTAVLIAEDDADIRDLLAFKLEQSGYEVIAVDDGQEALAAARDQLPEVALLDISMPGMSGLDVVRMLRADPRTAKMVLVLLTARAQESDVDTGFTAGADDYLVKPFSPRELADRLQALLSRSPDDLRRGPARVRNVRESEK